MLRKGFIGPIGDDLPSLIPLLIALVIFFSSFTFAFVVFDDRTANFKADLESQEVARVLRYNGYIADLASFKQLCSRIQVSEVSYFAGISTKLPEKMESGDTIFDFIAADAEDVFLDDGDYTCTNADNEDIPESPGDAKRYQVITTIYPVAVEHETIAKAAHLLVITWK